MAPHKAKRAFARDTAFARSERIAKAAEEITRLRASGKKPTVADIAAKWQVLAGSVSNKLKKRQAAREAAQPMRAPQPLNAPVYHPAPNYHFYQQATATFNQAPAPQYYFPQAQPYNQYTYTPYQ